MPVDSPLIRLESLVKSFHERHTLPSLRRVRPGPVGFELTGLLVLLVCAMSQKLIGEPVRIPTLLSKLIREQWLVTYLM